MRARLIACVLPTLVVAADAAAQNACGHFSWSLGHSIDLFEQYLPTISNAQSLPREGVFAVELKPIAEVIYPVPPSRARDGGFGAVMTLERVPAGRYRIVLSQEAWVDVVQGDVRLPLFTDEAAGRCPAVRRSLQIDIETGPLILELGGASVSRLNIAVTRLWPPTWRW